MSAATAFELGRLARNRLDKSHTLNRQKSHRHKQPGHADARRRLPVVPKSCSQLRARVLDAPLSRMLGDKPAGVFHDRGGEVGCVVQVTVVEYQIAQR